MEQQKQHSNQNKEKKQGGFHKYHGQAGFGHGQHKNKRHHKNNASADKKGTNTANATNTTTTASTNAVPVQAKVQNNKANSSPKPNVINEKNKAQENKNIKRKHFQKAESLEDIKRDLQRIEKEIWLEISDIASLTLD